MDHLDKILLMLIQGLTEEAILTAAVAKLGMDRQSAEQTLHEARCRLTLAAEVNRVEALGAALSRLNDCYAKSVAILDVKTALQAQKELNRLLRLDDQAAASAAGPGSEKTDELAEARAHLAPLDLGDEATSLVELCRRAALKLLDRDG
jgi:hypothetical protein